MPFKEVVCLCQYENTENFVHALARFGVLSTTQDYLVNKMLAYQYYLVFNGELLNLGIEMKKTTSISPTEI